MADNLIGSDLFRICCSMSVGIHPNETKEDALKRLVRIVYM